MGLGSEKARRAGVVGIATALIALTSLALDVAGPITQAQAQSASDARATFVEGNATTCGEVGFGADVQDGSSSNSSASDANVAGTVKTNAGPTHTGEGQELDVAITGGNVVIDAVVVKGSDAYNLYTSSSVLPPALTPDQHYIPPFNGGGNIGVISHWFVCYHLESPTTTTTSSTTTSTSTSSTTTSRTIPTTTTSSSTTTSTTIPATTTSSSTTSTTIGSETTVSLPSTTTTSVPVTVSTEGSTSTTEPTTTTVASVTTEGPTVSTSPTAAGSSTTAAAATGTLPRTGGPSTTAIFVGGATLMLGLALTALRPRRRQRS
jgi:hypothetical protein